jgi:pimeloyl-[acyl-carrier protein] methyl ester esterase
MKPLPVILVSGWAHGPEALAWVAESLAGRRTLLCAPFSSPDFRSGGEHGELPGPEALERPSSCARAIGKRIGESGGRAFVVGWSAGGMAALEAAARFPEEVAGVALLGSTARFCSGEGYPHGAPAGALRAMRRALVRNPGAVLDDFFRRASHPGEISEEALARKTGKALDFGAALLSGGLGYLERTDLRPLLKSIRQPALVIHGREDGIIPWGAGEYLSRELSRCAVQFLSGAGHLLAESHPEAVIARLQEFLEDFQDA